MWVLDFIFLVSVSFLVAEKNLLLGVLTLVFGFLVGFQEHRSRKLLGVDPKPVLSGQKIRAGILSIAFGLSLMPLVMDQQKSFDEISTGFRFESLLPIFIVLGLLSSLKIATLSTERKKR